MKEIAVAYHVHENGAMLAQAAATTFVSLAQRMVRERDRFSVALAGGSTPRATYQLLATDEYAAQVDWNCIHVFWGDERMVPPDDPQSNYRMARETLLDQVPLPAANIHRMRGELEPLQAATAYASELQDALEQVDPLDPRLDLILLGLGTDGHTASLFPGTDALHETERSVVAVYVSKLNSWRITLTLPTINRARNVLFLVTGEDKAQTFARVRAGDSLPAALVQPAEGRVTWLLDRAAAGV